MGAREKVTGTKKRCQWPNLEWLGLQNKVVLDYNTKYKIYTGPY